MGGVNVQRPLYLQYHDEVHLSKAPNPQLLPGCRSINGYPLLPVCVHGVCVFTAVCVCTWMGKCRARIPSMGHHTWLYVTSLSLSSLSFVLFNIFNYCRFASYSEFAFHCFLLILINTESIFASGMNECTSTFSLELQ